MIIASFMLPSDFIKYSFAIDLSILKILDRNKDIEYLIVETTGLADPLPVAMTINSARDKLRLDSIITLVDAENFNEDTLSSQIARSQIIYGDILLVNKCDLVSKERLSYIDLLML